MLLMPQAVHAIHEEDLALPALPCLLSVVPARQQVLSDVGVVLLDRYVQALADHAIALAVPQMGRALMTRTACELGCFQLNQPLYETPPRQLPIQSISL
jgi:hypothetical protein